MRMSMLRMGYICICYIGYMYHIGACVLSVPEQLFPPPPRKQFYTKLSKRFAM